MPQKSERESSVAREIIFCTEPKYKSANIVVENFQPENLFRGKKIARKIRERELGRKGNHILVTAQR